MSTAQTQCPLAAGAEEADRDLPQQDRQPEHRVSDNDHRLPDRLRHRLLRRTQAVRARPRDRERRHEPHGHDRGLDVAGLGQSDRGSGRRVDG